MDPVNYNLANPQQAILQGVQLGSGLDQLAQQRQQQALAQQAAMQQQADLRALVMKPDASHDDYAAIMTKYPAMAENLGKAFKLKDDGAKQNALNFGTRVYSALLAGNNDLATGLIEDRAKASPAEAQDLAVFGHLIQQSPQMAKTLAALKVAALAGVDKFGTMFPALGAENRAIELAPADLMEKRARAATAVSTAGITALTAENKPTEIALTNETARQGILTADAQRRVADFNAQIGAANSETQRGQLTLERDKFVAEQTAKQATAGKDEQDQFDVITQGLDTIKGLRADLDNKWKWTGVGSYKGEIAALIPGSDAKDFRAKMDTLKGQQFLAQSQKMKGLGALTEIEGAKIEKAVATLDPKMSEGAFRNALGIIETNLAKGHAKLIAMGKLPKDGGAFVMRHPVYGNVGDGDIQRLMAQNPGTTRDQVIQYLRSTGGQ